MSAVYITTEGLILRETNYKDADKILTVLTREGGRRTVKARGCRRKGSRVAASAQLLVYSDMTLFVNRDFYTLNEASSKHQFGGIRADVEKLALASYFAEVTDAAAEEGRPDDALFALILNCLYALDRLEKPPEQVKAAFELRLMSIAGYRPDLDGCRVCGGEDPELPHLHLSEGALCCAACRAALPAGQTLPVSSAALRAMRYIIESPPKKILSFALPDGELKQLSAVTQAYVTSQFDRSFATARFYEQMKSAW